MRSRPQRGIGVLAAALLVCGCAAAPVAPAPSTPPVAALSVLPSLAPAIRRALPHTVGVYAGGGGRGGVESLRRSALDRLSSIDDEPHEFDAENLLGVSIGAGILLDAAGLVATAAHVVAGSDPVVVRLPDERVLPAQRVGADADTDIALLRVDTGWPPAPLSAAPLPWPRAGDWVLALGEPYGLERSAMAGIVSGPRRHFADDGEVLFIQTSIAINPGHSGGPLVDAEGRVVGMNLRAVVGPLGLSGLGLAVPLDLVRQVAAELQAGPAAARPRWGLLYEDLLPPEALAARRLHSSGAVVRAVRRDGLAERLGLAVGDIVVGLDGRPIGNSAELARLMRRVPDAARARLVVFRDGAYRALPAR